ncbi:AzlC family ABC transporter permease [Streptococcus parasanguinis]|uniref:AzlC family ABC transporter permease n=1 Tax=Streptococcus parasanguinis TaxID=1318 RepID=UPI00352F1448
MKREQILKAMKTAFPYTIPIFAAFWCLGLSYGIYMYHLGFSAWYPSLMSLLIFAGSVEFVAGNMLLGAFDPLQALVLTIMINARHLFYGLAMLQPFQNTGLKKIYLIFGMCDESFSINSSAKVPEGVDRGWFKFFVTLFNHLYWFSGATIGGLLGNLLSIKVEGIEFVMVAMFVVIFMESCEKKTQQSSALIGLFITFFCLILFGKDYFILPSMGLIILIFTLLRKKLEVGV